MAVSHASGRGGLAGIGAGIVPWRQLAIEIVNVSDRLTAPPARARRPLAVPGLGPSRHPALTAEPVLWPGRVRAGLPLAQGGRGAAKSAQVVQVP
jgi:hypothetical protein